MRAIRKMYLTVTARQIDALGDRPRRAGSTADRAPRPDAPQPATTSEGRSAALREAGAVAHAATQAAIEKGETATENRRRSMAELRSLLSERVLVLMPRSEFEQIATLQYALSGGSVRFDAAHRRARAVHAGLVLVMASVGAACGLFLILLTRP